MPRIERKLHLVLCNYSTNITGTVNFFTQNTAEQLARYKGPTKHDTIVAYSPVIPTEYIRGSAKSTNGQLEFTFSFTFHEAHKKLLKAFHDI